MRRRALALLLIGFCVSLGLVGGPSAVASGPFGPAMATTCTSSVDPDSGHPAVLPPKQAGFHAAWYGQSGYMRLCPGDAATATLAYYNSGSLGWVRTAEAASLGTWGPDPGQDRVSLTGGDGTNGSPSTGWARYNRPAVQSADYVGPGQVATFQFRLRAPAMPGVYLLGLRPLIEGITWMEDWGVFWVVTVLNPDGTAPPFRCAQCWPLSGTSLGGAEASRRPLSVKVDNAPLARPHYGLSQADMVWETLVEGYVTRLNAIFHSRDAAVIGSVRSGRLFDRYLTPSLRGALAYSGATIEEQAGFDRDAAAGAYADISANIAGSAYYRAGYHAAPHNLFTSTAALRQALAAQGKGAVPGVPTWDFALPKFETAYDANGLTWSVPATSVSIAYRALFDVSYRYDAGTRTYARWQAGVREIDAMNGQPIAAANIVILGTEVWTTTIVEDNLGSLGLDERTTGSGPCSVFTQGRRQDCTWSRATLYDPFTLTNFYGKRILLSPGQTWVHLKNDWRISSSP